MARWVQAERAVEEAVVLDSVLWVMVGVAVVPALVRLPISSPRKKDSRVTIAVNQRAIQWCFQKSHAAERGRFRDRDRHALLFGGPT